MKKHTLSQFVAAYLLFESYGPIHKLGLPHIKRNLKILWQTVRSKLNAIDIECGYKLKKKSTNDLVNVYKNLCENTDIQHDMKNLFEVHNLIKDEFDLEWNLVELILETMHENCAYYVGIMLNASLLC